MGITTDPNNHFGLPGNVDISLGVTGDPSNKFPGGVDISQSARPAAPMRLPTPPQPSARPLNPSMQRNVGGLPTVPGGQARHPTMPTPGAQTQMPAATPTTEAAVPGPITAAGGSSGGSSPLSLPVPGGGGGSPTSTSASDPSSTPSASEGGASYAEGGAIPDEDDPDVADVGAGAGGLSTISSALNTVQQTLQYGRQKNGVMQGKSTGAALDPADSNDVHTKFQNPSFVPTQELRSPVDNQGDQSFAEGGTVEDEDASDQSGAIPDDGAQDSDASQSQGQEAQQSVPQAQPQQGGAPAGIPPKLVSYVKGADGAPPQMVQAMEARIDPQGRMDPSTRKIMTIASAPTPDAKWGIMQHYRGQFNAYKSFSRAALNGTPQKPGDIRAAALAATQAYQNVPDGNDLTFTPSQNGVTVTVNKLGAKAPAQGGQGDQSFAEGGAVDDLDEPTDNNDPGGVTAGLPAGADVSEAAPKENNDPGGVTAGSITLSKPALNAFLASPESEYDSIVGGSIMNTLKKFGSAIGGALSAGGGAMDAPPHPGFGATQTAATVPAAAAQGAAGQATPASGDPQSLHALPVSGFASGPSAQQRAQADPRYTPPQDAWAKATIPSTAPPKPAVKPSVIDPDIIAQADELMRQGAFGHGGEVRQARAKYIMDQMAAASTAANKVEVAQNSHLYGSQATAAANVERSANFSASRVQIEQVKAAVAAKVAALRYANPALAQKWKDFGTITAAHNLTPSQQKVQMQLLGLDPNENPGAPAAQAAPHQSAPAPTGIQVSPQDAQYLVKHPEHAREYDARFGAGTSQRILGGQ